MGISMNAVWSLKPLFKLPLNCTISNYLHRCGTYRSHFAVSCNLADQTCCIFVGKLIIVKASTYFHDFPKISSLNHWFILLHLSFGSLVWCVISLNDVSKHLLMDECVCQVWHTFLQSVWLPVSQHYGVSLWLWITLPVSLLNLLDIHIYKMYIIKNEGASGISLTGVGKLLVLLDGNLVCCYSVTSFQFKFICYSGAGRNILSLFSSSYSCVTIFVCNPHNFCIYLWAGWRFSLKSTLTGCYETSLKPNGSVKFVD
jgi:hypothetical protein